jgi:hypothetical protein
MAAQTSARWKIASKAVQKRVAAHKAAGLYFQMGSRYGLEEIRHRKHLLTEAVKSDCKAIGIPLMGPEPMAQTIGSHPIQNAPLTFACYREKNVWSDQPNLETFEFAKFDVAP